MLLISLGGIGVTGAMEHRSFAVTARGAIPDAAEAACTQMARRVCLWGRRYLRGRFRIAVRMTGTSEFESDGRAIGGRLASSKFRDCTNSSI